MSNSTPNPESQNTANNAENSATPPPPPPVIPPANTAQPDAGIQPDTGNQVNATPEPKRPEAPQYQQPEAPQYQQQATQQYQQPEAPQYQPQATQQYQQHSAPEAHTQVAPAYQAQPGPAAPSNTNVAKKHGSDFGNQLLANVKNVWEFSRLIFSGRPTEAITAAQNTPFYTWLALGVLALTHGLFLGTSFSRGVGAADRLTQSFINEFQMGGYYQHESYMDWGVWFKLVFTGLIVMGLIIAARTLTVYWTFRIGRVKLPYGKAAAIVATAVTPMVLVLVPVSILYMIPNAGLTAILGIVMLLISVPLTWIAELMIYIGLNRTARFERSPLMPHILMNMVWGIFIVIIFVVYMSIAMS